MLNKWFVLVGILSFGGAVVSLEARKCIAPVLTTSVDDDSQRALEYAENKERIALKAVIEAQDAQEEAARAAKIAAAKSLQEANAQAAAAMKAVQKSQDAQMAAETLIKRRSCMA